MSSVISANLLRNLGPFLNMVKKTKPYLAKLFPIKTVVVHKVMKNRK